METDPRKSLARLSHTAEAAPFDRAAAQALLATVKAWPAAKVGGGQPIEISHAPLETTPSAARRPVVHRTTAKWAAVAAVGVFAVGAGLISLHDRRATPRITAEAPGATPAPKALAVPRQAGADILGAGVGARRG